MSRSQSRRFESADLDQLLSQSFSVSHLHKSSKTSLERATIVYGRTPLRSNASSKSTLRLHTTNTTPSRTLSRLPSSSSKTETAKPRVPSVRRLQELQSANVTCRSDFLELHRDIATYEYNFLRMTSALPALEELSSFIPRVIARSNDLQDQAAQTLLTLGHLVTTLSHVTQESSLMLRSAFQRVNYEIKRETDQVKPRLFFRGIRKISGQYVLLRVFSNGWLMFFDIYAQLLEGGALHLRLNHGLEGLTIDLGLKELTRRLDLLLFQRLYIGVSSEGQLLLRYNHKHGEEYFMFPVKVRGAGNTLLLVSADGVLSLPGLDPITLPVPVDVTRAQREVSRHLHYNGAFQWYDPRTRFAAKESESLLMDPSFVTEKLGSRMTRATLTTQCEVEDYVFSVVLHSKGDFEQVTVFRGDQGRDADITLLKGLQFPVLSADWTTAMRSLELKHCIKKAFPELW